MLISHHPPSQYCRTFKLFGIRFCARCSGIILGMLIYFMIDFNFNWTALLILPLPTFINFLIQELQWIKSINFLKTFLTIPLGFYIIIMCKCLIELDLIKFLWMFLYILTLEFIIAMILNRNEKLDQLIDEYEKGMYKE